MFPLICGSGGSKNRLAKAAGPEPCGPVARGDMKIACRCGAKHVKTYKTHDVRTTFRSWGVEKLPAAVARSTFSCPNVQTTRCSDHFWKFRCRKNGTPLWARSAFSSQNGEKKPKRVGLGPQAEVQMPKNCTPLRITK